MYGTFYYYHTIVCSTVNIIATTFALLFNLGPLSVFRANNRKNLMPTIPDLSESAFNYIMSVTTFEKSECSFSVSHRSSRDPHQFYTLSTTNWSQGIQFADAQAIQVFSPALCERCLHA